MARGFQRSLLSPPSFHLLFQASLSLSLSQKQLLCVYAYSQFHLVLISIVYAFLISKLKVETAYDPNGAVFSLKRLYFLRKVCMQLRIL